MTKLQNTFAEAARQCVASALELPADAFNVSTPPRPDMGDLAVGCFPGAKPLRQAPAKLALRVVESFEATDYLKSASAAGPFVNFCVDRQALVAHVIASTRNEQDFISQEVGAGKTICVDYSSPNISKHLAYHHIRSTVIGQALCNMHRALGYRVVGINHLGDWGTTHGMLIDAYERWGADEPLTITKLNALYVRFREALKQDPALADSGRAAFARLEAGEEKAVELWRRFKDISLKEFNEIYSWLGIEFDEIKGESEYLSDVPKILSLLEDKSLSTQSDGALVVPFEDHEDMPPLLLRKQDGTTLYSTRDLAAAQYRHESYGFERSLYVVDRGQGLHFKQLFRVLKRAGFDWSERCEHIPFGLVRIAGKKTSTRSGGVVLLKDVFSEAVDNARERIAGKHPDLSADELERVANTVGVGAVVFANVMSERGKDVDFNLDDVLSTDGDSGPYVQYAYARICRMLEKSGESPSGDINASLVTHDAEAKVALALAQFPDILARATTHCDPHTVSRALIDIAGLFSKWYTAGNQEPALRILCEDEDTKRARLSLANAVRNVLRQGLAILGVGVVELM